MRKPFLLVSLSNSATCSQLSYVNEPHLNRLSCSSQGDYSFTRCSFFGDPHNPLAGNGGAISISSSAATLTVSSCDFHLLAVTGDGGAIYTASLPKVSITDSLFERCKPPGYEEGAIGAALIHSCANPFIQNCMFVLCTSFGDGGAVYFYYGGCEWNNGIAVQNSRFVCCKRTAENSRSDVTDGGGLMTYDNTQLIGVSNCLYSQCHSYKGGGMYLYILNYRDLSSIQFCFFTKNTGTYGNDPFVNFQCTVYLENIFLRSFTAGAANSFRKDHSSPHNIANNWLHTININMDLCEYVDNHNPLPINNISDNKQLYSV